MLLNVLQFELGDSLSESLLGPSQLRMVLVASHCFIGEQEWSCNLGGKPQPIVHPILLLSQQKFALGQFRSSKAVKRQLRVFWCCETSTHAYVDTISCLQSLLNSHSSFFFVSPFPSQIVGVGHLSMRAHVHHFSLSQIFIDQWNISHVCQHTISPKVYIVLLSFASEVLRSSDLQYCCTQR